MRQTTRLTTLRLLAGFALMALGTTFSLAAPPIKSDSMGLSKTSVFDVPTPKVHHYSATPAGQSHVLPRAYQGAPPQIPHDIADYLPITSDNNMCIACHNQPALWDKKRVAGSPTPIPRSHYIDFRKAPNKVTDHLIYARYNCNQCHVPQSDGPELVKNTFSSK